jgi:uncharacterized damage-inducible protein DinB
MTEQLLDAWRVNNRINLYLLDHISEEAMKCTTSTRGGRDVARQFAHVHNNRIYWLENHGPRGSTEGLQTFDGKYSPSKEELRRAFESSGIALERCFSQAMQTEGKLRSWKRGVFAAFGYHVAHESHHRGSILLTLKLTGNKMDQAATYAIWDWNTR